MPGGRDGMRAVWTVLAVTALLVLAPPLRAAPVELTPDERAWLAGHPTLRLGIDPDFAPLEFVDDQGHYSGMVADYVALVSRRLGVRIEPQFGLNWRESYASGLRQEIDLYASVGRTPDREQHFLFTAPYVDITSVIVMRSDHEGVVSADDLPDYRVALVEGYAESYYLLQRLPQLRVLFVGSPQAALEAVARGEADATIGSLPVMLFTIQKRGLTNLKVAGSNPTNSMKLHFMVRKDWPQLQSILQKTLGAITPEEHRKIQEGWFSVHFEPGLDPREVIIKVAGVGAIGLILILVLARWTMLMAREVRLRRSAEEEAQATATRLAESRAELEGANQRLHETTDSIAGAVFQIRLRPGGVPDLEFLSGRLAGTLGLSAGGGAADFEALLARILEDDRDAFRQSIVDAPQRGDAWEHEFRVEQPDGRVRWIRGESVPRRTPDGDFLASGYFGDVTERRAVEEALKRSEMQLGRALSRTSGQLQAILDNSPAAIWAKNMQGKYQFANEAFRRMFSVARENVAGSTDEDFFPARMVDVLRANDRTVMKTRAAASFVEPLERAGSEQHILSVKFPLFDEHGDTVAIGGMSLDITEQVQLQEELRQVNRDLALREQQLLQISRSSVVDRGDLDGTQRLVTTAACAGLQVRRASVWFWNEARDAVECRLQHDVEEGTTTTPQRLVRSDYPRYFTALDSGRALIAHDVSTLPATAELVPEHLAPLGITSMLDMPVRHGGQVVGVLCCEHIGPARRWRDEESFFAGALADAVGRAIVASREQQAEQALRTLNATLEERVEQRTRELREAMETLQAAQASLALKEAEAREAQVKLSDITDSLPGSVYQMVRVAPNDYRFLFVSSGMLGLVGVPREALLERDASIGGLIVPEDQEGLLAAAEAACATMGGFSHTFRLVHALTREVRWMFTQATTQRMQDGTVIFNGSVTDLTEQKNLEVELAKAREAAESANRAKGDFLANMSHEIRTPMNAVIGLSHLALKMDLGGRQRDYLTKIHSAGQSLLGLINDILDLSKIEAGKLMVERIEFDLDAVLDNLATVVGQKAHDKGLEFVIDRPDAPDVMVGDPMRLGQVLINLANNAVKFTERGEVAVKVTLEPDGESGMRLRAIVRDTGIGLTEEQQARLFRPFEQADASTTRRHGGTGLGLAISRQLVSLMNGRIWLRSEWGVGSEFGFEVQLGRSTSPARARKVTPSSLNGLRILVVDDNPTSREILSRYVTSFGFDAVAVASGRAALEALSSAGEPFGLVLLDWKMDDMDGLACANAIRSLPLPEAPRLVMVSAYAREELLTQVDTFRFDGFLLKPVNPSLLFDAILGAFGQSLPVVLLAPDAREAEAGRGLAGLDVLMVEDNAINQQIAYEILEGVGVRVTIANHGREALEWLDRARFDAVLMDMQMPVMDGLEATRVIRADPRFGELPVIAMTANAMQQDREQCLAAGMNDHVAKPIDVPELFRSLARWTGRQAVPVALAARVSAPAELVAIEGFDVHNGLQRFQNDLLRYRRLVRRFVDSEAEATTRVAAAVDRSDWATARRQVHSLKGLAATIGATRVAEAAGLLESALRAGRAEAALLARLEQEMKRLLEPLAAWLGHGDVEAAPAAPGDIRRLLETLERQLASDDTAAAETLDELGSAMVGHPQEIRLAGVRRALGDYDFEAAQAALGPLAEALEN